MLLSAPPSPWRKDVPHMRKKISKFILVLSLVLGFSSPLTVFAQAPWNGTLMLWAETKENPPVIRLKWSAPPAEVTGYTLHRKERDAAIWGEAIATLDAGARAYRDTNVEIGKTYEYRLVSMKGFLFAGNEYLWAGIRVPPVENRGKIVLLVEAEIVDELRNELETLRRDLIGDGWSVLRRDVSRNATPQEARQLVLDAYGADPGNVKAVFLLGRLPVFDSGSDNIAPDMHKDQFGKWPADAYYGYMSDWTDSSVNTIPGPVALQVGRADFDGMPAFQKSAVELLRQYLNKNHRYRTGKMTTQKDCLIDDVFKSAGGEAFSRTIYRTCSAIWGENASITDNYPEIQHSYTWGSYTGPGGRTSVTSVTGTPLTTTAIAGWSENVGTIFSIAFGSYFGKWDHPDNLLRAFLATPNHGLASMWSGRPLWYLHHMALGETIGYSARLTMNNGAGNSATYMPLGTFARGTHIALMGDPTLRMFPVLPASNLRAEDVDGKVKLKWDASRDKKATEYYIYGAHDEGGPYVRLAATGKTAWIDGAGMPYSHYMVRAKKLTKTASGSYYNLSQGVFAVTGANAQR